MNTHIFYSAGQTNALSFATAYLQAQGCCFAASPDCRVTHLLLDVPFKSADTLQDLLPQLSKDVTIVGGNLDVPGYCCIDLLQDPFYLAENADITAQGAVKLMAELLPVTFRDLPVLVIGWGRIGKCLAQLLRRMGCNVTVAARKESDRAMLVALGYDAVSLPLKAELSGYRVILNTVPAPVVTDIQLTGCCPQCLKIELASKPGLIGNNVINGRALPNRFAPESSGQLIGRSILRLCGP